MLKITNGISTFEVTEGAFESIYKQLGFKEVGEEEKKEPEAPEEGDTNELSEDEKFCEELLEKPISSWNKEEVKRFAAVKGIDISNTKNANEAKGIIKEYLEEEE